MNYNSMLPLPSNDGFEWFNKEAREYLAACRRDAGPQQERYSMVDARKDVARSYGFESAAKLAEFIARIGRPESEVLQFESAVNAIVAGDAVTLSALLRANPELVHLRSMRLHHAMLLHYTCAQGVEGYRRFVPANIITIAQLLLAAGADVNAPYHGAEREMNVLQLVAISDRLCKASVQRMLMETFLLAGAVNQCEKLMNMEM